MIMFMRMFALTFKFDVGIVLIEHMFDYGDFALYSTSGKEKSG